MTIQINRTLIVGLGSPGRRIVQRLRRRLQEQYSGLPYVAFLTIYPEGEPKGEAPWTDAEEIQLSAWELDEFVAKNPKIRSRLPGRTSVIKDPFSTRMGTNLAFQRLMKEGREGKIARTLETTIQRLFGPRERFWQGTSQEFEVARQKKDASGIDVPVREVTVYVVAALNDPVGSGILLDFTYALQQQRFFAEQTYDCSVVGVLLSFDESPSGLANSYAALKEVDAAMSQEKFQNEFQGLDANYRPFNRACYFVELSNEAGYPDDLTLRQSSYGEVMVADWLRWMLTNLVEVESEMKNIQARLARVEWDSTRAHSQGIPAYSSFGFAAVLIPVKELLDYFAYRLGEAFASDQCLLAIPPAGAELSLVEAFWKEGPQTIADEKERVKYKMDARTVADVMTEEEKEQYRTRFEEDPFEDYARPMEGNIALPVVDQLDDTAVFSPERPFSKEYLMPPEPGPTQELERKLRRLPILGDLLLAAVRAIAFLRKDAEGLHTLLQEIRFKHELQNHAESEHIKRVQRKLDQEIVPSSLKIVGDESWKVVSNQPVGGVALAIAFCHTLGEKLSHSRRETERVCKRVQEWDRKGTCTDPDIHRFFPDFVLLMVFVTFMGLVLTIAVVAMGVMALGFPGLLQQAFPLEPSSFFSGDNLLIFLLTFGYSGDFLFAIFSRTVNFIKNKKPIVPDADPPVLRATYFRGWLVYLGVFTALTSAVMVLQWMLSGGVILPLLILIPAVLASSAIILWEYNWTNQQYQQALEKQKTQALEKQETREFFIYIPSREQLLRSIGLTIAHTVALVVIGLVVFSRLDTVIPPVVLDSVNQNLWRWLTIMAIIGIAKYLFDYVSARFTVFHETVDYADFGSALGTAFFVLELLVGLIGLTVSRSPFHELGMSRLRNLAITGVLIFTLYAFIAYMFRRIRLHEFPLVFPPTTSPSVTYQQAKENGRKALRNSDWRVPLWRGAVMIALTIIVMAWLEQRFAANILAFLLTGLQFQSVDPTLEDRILLLAILGAIYVLKYVVDLILIFVKRENLPSTRSLVLSLLLPVVVTFAVCFSVTLEVFPFGDWVDAAHRDRVVQAVVLLGVLVLIRYLWEYVNDLARIWYLAKDWIAWYEKMALQRLRIECFKAALQFYDAMIDFASAQANVIEQFKGRVRDFGTEFVRSQSAIKGQIVKAEAEYQRFVLDPDRAETIYRGQVLADIASEARNYFGRHPLLETWRGQSVDTVREDLKVYINERFEAYWREHGVINFLADSPHPTYRDLERKIGWLFAKASKPYWRYYGATHGEFFAYVGVPARESGELKEAVLGLAGPLVGGPVRELATGDPYSVTSITFRHGISLSLLSSIAQYQRSYQDQIEESPWLHTRGTPVEEPEGLVPEGRQGRIGGERTRQPRRQLPQTIPPPRNTKRHVRQEAEDKVLPKAETSEETSPQSLATQPEQDYYHVLGVPRDATDEDIDRAYSEQIFRYRPSAYKGEEGDRMRLRLREAYDVLSDREKRKDYDGPRNS